MKITDIKTFLMMAGAPASTGSSSWSTRNWCFVKVYTDEGIIGIGEGSGWPRVIQTALEDLRPIVVGEDPFNIERIWQKMLVSTMGNGMTGTPGSGAMNAIDMALWDIKGKALNPPVWNLLGGKVRDKIRAYGHAATPERARELVDNYGLTGLKTGGVHRTVDKVDAIRKEVGDEIDIMVDAHGPPWFTTKDAIIVGKALEPYNLLFYEDPVPPDNVEALKRVQDNVDIPIAAGERHSHIWGVRRLIEEEVVDVVQPDTGRIGGISQLMKLSAMAEAHYLMVAPHSGSLGPIAEYAAIHVLAAIPNALILERVHDDVPVRYEVVPEIPTVDGYIQVPDAPGLGVDIDENVVAAHPSSGNTTTPGKPDDGNYEPGTYNEHLYVQARYRRQHTLRPPR